MQTSNRILADYLKKMGVNEKIPLGEPVTREAAPSPETAKAYTSALVDQLSDRNRFNRLVNYIVLICYSLLFGLGCYFVVYYLLKTTQPLSLLSGGGGIILFLLGIIRSIGKTSADARRISDVLAILQNVETNEAVRILEIFYKTDKLIRKR